jgi:hypothetical protein
VASPANKAPHPPLLLAAAVLRTAVSATTIYQIPCRGIRWALYFLAEGFDGEGRPVGAKQHVPPHEEVPEVEDEALVVYLSKSYAK